MISEYTINTFFGQAKTRGWVITSGSLASGWRAVYRGRLHDFEVYLESPR